MKQIKVNTLRPIKINSLLRKTSLFSVIFVSFLMLLNVFNLNVNYLTDILGSSRISKTDLYKKAKVLSFSHTVWPVKYVTDYHYKLLQNKGITYSELRKKNWTEITDDFKILFPTKWESYINENKNINLSNCWKIFDNPRDLNEFTFRNRVLRATWTSSYDSSKIWKKYTGTHAGIDIIGNKGTPVYSIANGLVVIKRHSNKGFGNYIVLLHKINGNYYASIYGHLDKISNIKVGQLIPIGIQIATIGDSGNSFGTHLHFQLNKVSNLNDILDGKIMLGWFHSLDGVKEKTVDPIEFIEKYYKGQGDNLDLVKKGKLDDIYEKKHYVAEKKTLPKTKIENISLSLVENKIQLGHSFKIHMHVKQGEGKISIVPSNSNLKFSKDLIQNPSSSDYTIDVLALKEGKTKFKVLDGNSIREYSVDIYKLSDEKITGIKVKLGGKPTILSHTEITVYPIDKFGNIVHKKIQDKFNIYQYINGKKVLLNTVVVNLENPKIYIKFKYMGPSKLIIESKKFYLKLPVNVDISQDYSYKAKYSKSIEKLIKSGIVKGDNGKLYPYSKINRGQLLMILGRSILKTDYNKSKLDMLSYIKTKGKFFKDIDGFKYADPYIYDAWKKGIIKGYKGNSLVSSNVTKGQLLLIYARLFKIPPIKQSLYVWKDVQDKELRYVANTIKRYNLYPFTSSYLLGVSSYVSREVAFESLERFIEFNPKTINIVVHSSAEVPDNKDDLTATMNEIFDF